MSISLGQLVGRKRRHTLSTLSRSCFGTLEEDIVSLGGSEPFDPDPDPADEDGVD